MQHPSDSTAAEPGPKARATKNYDQWAYPSVTRNDAQFSYKAYHVAPHLHEQTIVSDISSTFRSLLPLILHCATAFRPISLGEIWLESGDREDR